MNVLKKIIFTLLLSLVLSTSHFTPAQAIGGPIGNFNCNTGVLDASVAEDDELLSTYFVMSINPGIYEITAASGAGCVDSVTIAPGVTSIGDAAFQGNTALTEVIIGNSVISIGSYAFGSNTSLFSVTIPNFVTTIGDFAFESNTSLTEVIIGSSVETIGDYAFYGNAFTTITIPDSVISIGAEAFSYNDSLLTVTIGSSVTTIGDYAFSGNIVLASVIIPDSVTSIGNGAFQSNALTLVTIGNSVITIGGDAFLGNTLLETVTIPNSVTTIGASAFSGTGLTSITIPNSVTAIGYGAFGEIPAFTLTPSSETVTVNIPAIGFTLEYLSAEVNPINPFSISPTPPGMDFNRTTGALSGTPSTAASATAYTVTATNGSFSASTIFTLTVLGAGTAPAAPTLNSVTGGNKQLSIAFTPGGDGGAAITDYEYSLNGGAYTSAGITTSPFTITGLSGRTAYSVTIKARNSIGLSTASSSLSATTTDSSLDANEAAAAEAARVAAANAAAEAAKKQKELTELLSVIPSIAGLALNLGDLTNTLLLKQKCVKGTKTTYVKKGAKCPKGYVKKK